MTMALTQVSDNGLTNTGVTAATYGSSSAIPSLTIDAKGRITAASTTSIDSTSIANGTSNVTVAANSNIDFVRAGNTEASVVDGGIKFTDNKKALFGSSSDLQIFHDGSNSYIDDAGTGNLKLNSNEVHILSNDNSEYSGRFISNGAAELYYDGSKKFETKSDGVDVTGEVQCDSLDVDGNVNFNGSHHYFSTSSTSNASLTLKKSASGADSIDYLQCRDNANGLKAKIGGSGEVECLSLDVNGSGDISGNLDVGGELNLIGSGDGAKYIDARVGSGGTLSIRGTLGGDANHSNLATFTRNGAVNLYNAGQSKLSTTSTGVNVTGTITCDGLTVDGTFTQSNGNGIVTIKDSNNTGNNTIAYVEGKDSASNQKWFVGHASTNNQDLYINNTAGGQIRFRSSSADRIIMQAAGHFVPQTNNSIDLGSSGTRWRNVYTNDLNLSNEGSANDIDGTWGNFTIQEGEDDLFLINRRNGKKYKFNLTEVS